VLPVSELRNNRFAVIMALFCALLLISNVAATKLIAFGPEWSPGGVPLLPLITDGGAFLFPLTYILGDVLAEVYGFARTRLAIFLGFALAALMSLTFLVVDLAPASADWPLDSAWHDVLGFVPRIVVASLLGYLAGQLLNAFVLVRVKARFGPQRLWIRLLSSSVVGEAADTIVFCSVAYGALGAVFGGESISFAALLNYIAVGFVWKMLVETALLPLTYRVIGAVKQAEEA
jgi:uncharacterized integral membrane protein (TIGR00697 family)